LNISASNAKFRNGADLEFFSIMRGRVDDYFEKNGISKHANSAMIIKTIVLVFFYVAPFVALLLWQPGFWVSMGLWLLMGLAVSGIGMSVMHDANHGAYSSSEKVNRWVGYSLNFLGGSVANWKMQHNILHHTFTNVTGLDEDIDTKLILRFSPHAEHRKVYRFQWLYAFVFYSILTLYWGVAKDLVQYFGYKKKGLNKNNQTKNIWFLVRISAVKIVYFFTFLVLPVLVTSIPFYQILIGFIFMHVLAGLILSVIFQMAHTLEETEFPMPDETGTMENSWAIHQLKTTADFSQDNKLLSWYIGGLNFQVEHHLFPRICHVHYPAIAPIIEETAREFGVPYLVNRTFASAFKSHLSMLQKLGRPKLDEIMG
jgi:linoleoyl-CoA desaturase